MSKLGNLFNTTSSPAENNDSLKYVAPREPKKNSPSAPPLISVPAAMPSRAAAATPVAAAPQASPGASKVIASAPVRLYKYASTGYEAQAGGAPLGCVLVGSGVQYQILIYNAQKAPQATALISPTFNYNLRDLYVSFSDTAGNNWSILFDVVDVMTTFVRTLVATMCHIRCHLSNEADQTTVLKGSLPPSPTIENDPSLPTLTAGMSAGISYRAWEVCGAPNETPTEAIAYNPFLQSPINDFAKIKVGGSSDDPIGGMGAALVGCQKGDRLFLGIPTGIAYNNASGDMSGRKRPGMWVIVEIEIAKVKSDKDKKEKKKDKKVEPIPEPEPDRTSISSRMAHLSQQSGGAGVLAAMAGGERRLSGQGQGMLDNQPQQTYQQPPQQQPPPQQQQFQQPPQQQTQQFQSPPPQQQQQQPGQFSQQPNQQQQLYQQPSQQQQQGGYSQPNQQNHYQHQPPQQSHGGGYQDGGYQQGGQQGFQQNGYQPQQSMQQPQYSPQNYQQTPPQQQQGNYGAASQSPQQSYALTLVEGQEARSYYLNDDSTSSYVNQRQQQQQQQPHQLPHQQHAQQPQSGNQPSQDMKKQLEQLNQIQQTMIAVHSSLLGLHGKVDIMSSNSSSSALSSMPFGFNPSFQQLQQQQQLQQMMLGMGGNGMMGGPQSTGSLTGDSSLKLKGKQIIESVAEMVSDYDKTTTEVMTLKNQLAAANSMTSSRVSTSNHEQTINRLEEKIETLMSKNEKLLNEKSELFEKNSSSLDQLSELTSKLSRLQRELDSTRRERDESEDAIKVQRDRVTSLRMEIERLKDDLMVASASSSKSSTNAADKELISSLQSSLSQMTNEKNEMSDRLSSLEAQHQTALSEIENDWSQKFDTSTSELRATIRRLQDENDEKLFEKSAQHNKEKNQLEQSLQEKVNELFESQHIVNEMKREMEMLREALESAEKQREQSRAFPMEESDPMLSETYQKLLAEHQELQRSQESLQKKCNDMESRYLTKRGEHERLEVDHEELQKEVSELRAQVKQGEAALAAAAGSGAGGIDQEKINELMQNIYSRMGDLFPASAGGDSDDEEHVQHYTSQDVLKRCRKVLKQATAEFMEANAAESV